MKKLKEILLFLTFLFSINLFAINYPISPRPLRQLVIESENILVGYVVATFDKKEDSERGSKIAKIAILEKLQGEIKLDTIELEFHPNMSCPAPARYFKDTFVISFVNNYKGKYVTVALNYGSKTLTKEEIEVYKKRIFEMQNILKITNNKQRFKETKEWLVKCAENETTRWEGTFELSPESHFMSFYTRDKKIDYKNSLDAEQKNRLKTALLSSTNSNYVDFGLVDLVHSENQMEVDTYLLKKLKEVVNDDFYMPEEFLIRLKHKKNTIVIDQILEKLEKIEFDYSKEEEKKELVQQFINEIEK